MHALLGCRRSCYPKTKDLQYELACRGIRFQVMKEKPFFEYERVKDALAHLQLAVNVHDDLAFQRLLQRPPKGMGEPQSELLVWEFPRTLTLLLCQMVLDSNLTPCMAPISQHSGELLQTGDCLHLPTTSRHSGLHENSWLQGLCTHFSFLAGQRLSVMSDRVGID